MVYVILGLAGHVSRSDIIGPFQASVSSSHRVRTKYEREECIV